MTSRSNRRLPIATRALVLLVAAASTGSWGHAEELLYYVDAGRVVITNTPSRRDVNPVPGVSSPPKPGRAVRPGNPGGLDGLFTRVSHETGVSERLLRAVASVESGFDPRAVSPRGARGLMQLMPATARSYGVENVFDPEQNLRAGAIHLRGLLHEFDGDLELALAAYNAGSGAVRRADGVPPFDETRRYVQKVHQRLLDERSAPIPARRFRRAEPDASWVRRDDGTLLLAN